MDPGALASIVTAVLAKRFRSADPASAEEQPSRGLLDQVRKRAASDRYTATVLEGFEQRPDSQRRRLVFEQALAESVESDHTFGLTLEKVLKAAQTNTQVRAWDSGIVAQGFQAGRHAIGNVAGRDIVIGDHTTKG